MMALFGMTATPGEACRQAVAAARLIERRLDEMNRNLADELPEPIAVGIGLHAGNVILGEVGYGDRFLLTAIGDSVHVAARLQDLTKDYGCRMVMSDVVSATAGLDFGDLPQREVRMRGREAPLTVRMIGAMAEMTP